MLMSHRTSKLAGVMLPVPAFILSPEQAREALAQRGQVRQPPAATGPGGKAAPQMLMSQRDLIMIANLGASPYQSRADVPVALKKEEEPALSLGDFGVPLPPDRKAVLLTNMPLMRSIAGLCGRGGLVADAVTPRGAILWYYFRAVQDYFNTLIASTNYYPCLALAQALRQNAAKVFEQHGLNGFIVNGVGPLIFSLPDGREMSNVAFCVAHSDDRPNAGVVMAPEDYVNSFSSLRPIRTS
jgi:hypothetical protein